MYTRVVQIPRPGNWHLQSRMPAAACACVQRACSLCLANLGHLLPISAYYPSSLPAPPRIGPSAPSTTTLAPLLHPCQVHRSYLTSSFSASSGTTTVSAFGTTALSTLGTVRTGFSATAVKT